MQIPDEGVEFRVAKGYVEFRLLRQHDPSNYLHVVANASLEAQKGVWVPVPRDLMERVPKELRRAALRVGKRS